MGEVKCKLNCKKCKHKCKEFNFKKLKKLMEERADIDETKC